MNRKKLGIIASALALFALMLWFTQGYDEGAQAAASNKGTISATSNINASAAPSAAPRKSANTRSATPQPQKNATLAAQTGQRHTAATSTDHNDKTGSNTNSYAPTQSPTKTRARIKPAPLEPRAEPYALMANSGSATVRFSVRLIGDADSSTTAYLRQGGADGVISLNDRGVDGDIVAGDNIHGGNIVLDTSRLQPDTCLSYIAALRDGESETASSPLNLCISSFPVRVATPNTINPIVFEDGMKAVADEVLLYVVPTTSAARIQQLAQSINAAVVGSIIPLNMYQLRLPSPVDENQLTAIIFQLNAQEGVVGTSVNALGEPAGSVTNVTDPEFANQHGAKLVLQHPTLTNTYIWDAGATGSGVTVVVADEGLDRTHPEFGTPGNCQVTNNECGPTALNNDNPVASPAQWHGSRVAGVIVAKALNSQGIAGVAFDSKVHSYKIASYALSSMNQIFIDVGNYVAMDATASVINASFGGGPYTGVISAPAVTALCAAVNTAVTSGFGAIVVNAAGNNSSNGFYYPSRCNEHAALLPANRNRLISVGNSASIVTRRCGNAPIDQLCLTDLDNATKLGSNFGAWVEIAAPGSDIRTTISGAAYANATGTSFSAPMVSGAVAILKSCGVPLDQIEPTLKSSANVMVPYPLSGANPAGTTPRLDIYRALQYVNHGPSAVLLSNNSLNDGINTAGGAEVGTLTRTDPDTCDKHTYTITGGADAAKFTIGGTASDRLILTDGVLNFANKSSYAVNVRVTDFFGEFHEQSLTVNVAAVNHAPTITSQTFRVNEGSANTTAVGLVAASDPDSGNVLTYSLAVAGNTSSAFSINPSTGALTVNNSAALVYATNPTFSLTVTVTDGGGLTAAATVTVNVNKAPTISNQLFSINEGTANGTSVGAVAASDAGDTLTYSITASTPSSAFSINPTTGVISVSNSGALVHATNPTFSLTVRVTDSGGLTASATVTVSVNTLGTNNAPVIANQTFAVDDGSANGTAVGTVAASDPDTGNTLSYSITAGNTGNSFALNATTGALTVGNALSYATTRTYALTVRVADNGGLSATAIVTVNVNAAATTPPDPATPPAPSGGGGGCSVMPGEMKPDLSLVLVVLVLMGYGVWRRKS